jgi:hypothetical protein
LESYTLKVVSRIHTLPSSAYASEPGWEEFVLQCEDAHAGVYEAWAKSKETKNIVDTVEKRNSTDNSDNRYKTQQTCAEKNKLKLFRDEYFHSSIVAAYKTSRDLDNNGNHNWEVHKQREAEEQRRSRK